tara:strand:- start:13223 stop:13408 length:186 start_codon:yes stop_codon:yes gene_type:complete
MLLEGRYSALAAMGGPDPPHVTILEPSTGPSMCNTTWARDSMERPEYQHNGFAAVLPIGRC